MVEQDAVHIGCEADLAAYLLDVEDRQLSVKSPNSTRIDMCFDRSDLILTNI